jgi:hypothetical protein
MESTRCRLIDPTRRYVRTSGGRVVHTPDCPHAQRAARNHAALPWRWATGKTPAEIDREAPALGVRYRWCADCLGRGLRRLAAR